MEIFAVASPKTNNTIFTNQNSKSCKYMYYKDIGDYLKALKDMPITFTVESVNLEKSVESIDNPRGRDDGKDATSGKVLATMLISSYTIWQL